MGVMTDRLGLLSTNQLRELNSAVVAELKARIREDIRDKAREFRVGDTATFRGRDGRTHMMRIDRINQKTVSGQGLSEAGLLTGTTWKVDVRLLQRPVVL